MSAIVDLELTIGSAPAGYLLSARQRDSESTAYSTIARNAPLEIDTARLLELWSDPLKYGQYLAGIVFAGGRIWERVDGYVQGRGADLRVRLVIEEAASELHALCWERLCDPDGRPLAPDGRVSITRYVPTRDLQPVVVPSRERLTALIVVANPENKLGLSRFDAAGELRRAREALAGISHLTVLAEGSPAGRPTPAALAAAIGEGCDLLYLVCHGTMPADEPVLWLEDDQGKAARLPGAELERWLRAARRRPVLAVLASCHSAGNGSGVQATAAIGPRLAAAGVPAILAMQGLAPVAMVERCMPLLLRDLLAHGNIDRAVARARASLPLRDPWWIPALYTRVEDGQFWREGAAPAESSAPRAPALAAQQPARTRQRPVTLYLSSDDEDDALLQGVMSRIRLRGIEVVTGPTSTLASADICLLHVTEERLEDDAALERDVEAIRAEARRRPLPVLAVHNGVPRRELRGLLRSADLTWPERDLSDERVARAERLNQIAALTLELLVKAHANDLIVDGALPLALYTGPRSAAAVKPSLVLDWSEPYRAGYPGPETWRDLLLPALSDLRRVLGETNLRHIVLSARARLSAGVALGYAFRSVVGIDFRIQQLADWWNTAPHNASMAPLWQTEPPHEGSGQDITLEVNVSQEPGAVTGRVTQYLQSSGLAVGRRIALDRPPTMSNIISEVQAQAVASQVRTVLQRLPPPRGAVHLFIAAPFGVALMIGWHLNTLTPVQCYELPEGEAAYKPSCRIERI